MVDGTVEVYNLLGAEMRPTPSRSHYTFNMRDLSKVIQGLLMVQPNDVPDKETLIRLFMHEASRVFHDRLIDDRDRSWCPPRSSLSLLSAYFVLFCSEVHGKRIPQSARCISLHKHT